MFTERLEHVKAVWGQTASCIVGIFPADPLKLIAETTRVGGEVRANVPSRACCKVLVSLEAQLVVYFAKSFPVICLQSYHIYHSSIRS